MEKSESIKELAIALNKVQATIQTAKKDSVNPFFNSKYADLLSVWDACRETLTANGLSVTQIADMDSEGRAVLETVLIHTSGEWIKGRLPLSPVKTDPQAQGSAITYARRYSLSAIVGLCTEEDDDAEGAMSRGKTEGKSKGEIKGHWCSIHKTPFFKKGNMKNYAHPIKDSSGITSGWCNEEKKEEEVSDNEPVKDDLIIDMNWLNETLDELKWNPVEWLKKKYTNVKGATLGKAIQSLTREQQEEFVKEVQSQLDRYRGGQQGV